MSDQFIAPKTYQDQDELAFDLLRELVTTARNFPPERYRNLLPAFILAFKAASPAFKRTVVQSLSKTP
jgi:hypothetical protein